MEAVVIPDGPLALERVSVRPTDGGDERQRWDELMHRHHYLGQPGLMGRSLRYVAELDGQWLALVGWQSAALKCSVRDHWIGWPAVLQYQRLHLIANNARFLLLTPAGTRNLASRVLALNLRRLAGDYQQIYGHPVLLAETFIDPARFGGDCYRAANWRFLGTSSGFRRRPNGRYDHHGEPKHVAVYALTRHARHWLASPQVHRWWSQPMQPVTLSRDELDTLFQRLRGLPDPRRAQGRRHRFATVVTIAIAATLAGYRGYQAIAEWAGELTQSQLKRLRAYYNRRKRCFEPPSEKTIRRSLCAADPEALERCLHQWLLERCHDDTVAVDGKSIKGARNGDGPCRHLLAAMLPNHGAIVAQREVVPTANEISEMASLLDGLELQGRLVTADAMHTQRDNARSIVEDQGGDYLFTVKANQPELHQALAATDWQHFPPRR